MKGAFITFEGGEGSGKSTQLKLLKDYLEKQQLNFVYTREPGGTTISEKIRDLVLSIDSKEMSYECEALLYASARSQLINELILPSVNSGKLVVCDRYIDSSFVYQGIARELGFDFVEKINAFAIEKCMPDLTVFLDINPVDAFNRKGGADTSDRLEMSGMDFHRKVYDGYLALAEKYPERIVRIDATKTIDEIHFEIISLLKKRNII